MKYYEKCLKGKLRTLLLTKLILFRLGDAFRPDFQLLAVFRKLLEASQGKLRTMPFSATIDRNRDVIEEFFPNQVNFQFAGILRSEPLFWLKNFEAKMNAIQDRQILILLPRPPIFM